MSACSVWSKLLKATEVEEDEQSLTCQVPGMSLGLLDRLGSQRDDGFGSDFGVVLFCWFCSGINPVTQKSVLVLDSHVLKVEK